jgi:hypothetical protein
VTSWGTALTTQMATPATPGGPRPQLAARVLLRRTASAPPFGWHTGGVDELLCPVQPGQRRHIADPPPGEGREDLSADPLLKAVMTGRIGRVG